jgi:hypothetical protein
MIKTVEIYTVICDCCGKDHYDGTEYLGFNDKGFIVDDAKDSGWIEHDDKHYCSHCHAFDDDDNLIIKQHE